jgi:hypothetical protein
MRRWAVLLGQRQHERGCPPQEQLLICIALPRARLLASLIVGLNPVQFCVCDCCTPQRDMALWDHSALHCHCNPASLPRSS